MSHPESLYVIQNQLNAWHIREINPFAENEIELVAERMRATLVEVEGPEAGVALCSMEWLRERVKWHLDPQMTLAKVFLAVEVEEMAIGHTIVRREHDRQGSSYGLFSTTYVVPAARGRGVAHQLLLTGEYWMLKQALPSAATWTSETNSKLISLYLGHGYTQTDQLIHDVTGTVMVKLEKLLSASS